MKIKGTIEQGEKAEMLKAPKGVEKALKAKPEGEAVKRVQLSPDEQLVLGIELRRAAREGDAAEVKRLLKAGADVNAKDSDRWTALIDASDKGHTDIVKLLISNGANVNAKSVSGNTALIYASEAGHTDVVRLLVSNGADVNADGFVGWTALMSASKNGHTDVVEILRKAGATE